MPIIHRSRKDSDKESVTAHDADYIHQLLKSGCIKELPLGEKGHRNTIGYVYVNRDKPWKDFVEAVLDSNEEEIGDDDEDDAIPDHEYADANYVSSVIVTDPDSLLPVTICVFKDTQSGGMFAIDSSFLEQVEKDGVPSPFNEDVFLRLKGLD